MITSMAEKIKQVTTTIKTIIETEICTNGLLENVEEIYLGPKINIEDLNYPSIWVINESIVKEDNSLGGKSIELDKATYGFFCLDYDYSNPEESYKLSMALACNLVDTFEKHCFIKDDGESVFHYIKFVSMEQEEFPVSASNSVSMYGVKLEFYFKRQRTFCNRN